MGWKGAGLDPWDWEFSLFFRAFTLSGLVPRGVTARKVPGPYPLCCGFRDIIVLKAKRDPGPRLRHSNVERGGPPDDAFGGLGEVAGHPQSLWVPPGPCQHDTELWFYSLSCG